MDYFTRMVLASEKEMTEQEQKEAFDSRTRMTITDCFGFIERTMDFEDKKDVLVPPEDASQERLT